MPSGPDQTDDLSVVDDGDGSIPLFSRLDGVKVQLEYFDHSRLG